MYYPGICQEVLRKTTKSFSHDSRSLDRGAPVPIGQEAGWAAEPVSIQRLEGKSLTSAGDRTPIARSYSSYLGTVLTELPRLPNIDTAAFKIAGKPNTGLFRHITHSGRRIFLLSQGLAALFKNLKYKFYP
jgi:hypothetical protein